MLLKKNILIPLSFIGILALLGSCTPQQRIARILKRHPELIKSDTIFKRDTIYTVSVEKDTVFNYYTKDTVVIREGKLTMKYFYNDHDSTVYLKGKCEADTVYKMYPHVISSVNVEESKGFIGGIKSNLNTILISIILGFVLFSFFRR